MPVSLQHSLGTKPPILERKGPPPPHVPGAAESRGSVVPWLRCWTYLHRQVVGHGEARHGRQRAVRVCERRVRSAQHGTWCERGNYNRIDR